jgi:hypothetical protein
MTDIEWAALLVNLDGLDIETRLERELALWVYDFAPVEVWGSDGDAGEVWRDECGNIYTRDGALNIIRTMKAIGRGRTAPPAWESALRGGEAGTP